MQHFGTINRSSQHVGFVVLVAAGLYANRVTRSAITACTAAREHPCARVRVSSHCTLLNGGWQIHDACGIYDHADRVV